MAGVIPYVTGYIAGLLWGAGFSISAAGLIANVVVYDSDALVGERKRADEARRKLAMEAVEKLAEQNFARIYPRFDPLSRTMEQGPAEGFCLDDWLPARQVFFDTALQPAHGDRVAWLMNGAALMGKFFLRVGGRDWIASRDIASPIEDWMKPLGVIVLEVAAVRDPQAPPLTEPTNTDRERWRATVPDVVVFNTRLPDIPAIVAAIERHVVSMKTGGNRTS